MEQKSVVITNEEKFHHYRKNKILKIIIIFLSIGVIALEVLALLNIISMFWGIGLFVIIQILIKFMQNN